MPQVDLEAIRSRVSTELPQSTRWFIVKTPLDFTFRKARAFLTPLTEDEINGTLEPEWANIYLFAEADYANGGGAHTFIGIDILSGMVKGIDVESEEPPFLVNMNIDTFIKTFILLDTAFHQSAIPLNKYAKDVQEIDPIAFTNSWWWSGLFE
jgi:hypothetical protein